MTTLTSADGPSEVITARRTESLDAPNILRLANSSTEQLFGRVDVVNLIEKAVLAVTLSNDRDEILGHAAFYDYPNVAGVDPAAWEEWINTFYNAKRCTSLNTLFMHFFVAQPEYSHGCAKEIIRTMYNAVTELHYCFLVVPTGVYPDSALTDMFSMLERLDESVSPPGCVLFGCYRHNHAPVLYVRSARVEDTDDLVPLFNKQNAMLQKTYGDFFLAELVEAQNDSMKCLIAEVFSTEAFKQVDEIPIGFMSVSDDLNLDLLNECYELVPFNGLKKKHSNDIVSPEDEMKDSESEVEEIASETGMKSPGSQRSGGSVLSKKSAPQSPAPSAHSRASSRGSIKAEELKNKSKLSDQVLGGSQKSALSDHSDVASVKSDVQLRELASGQDATEEPDTEDQGKNMTRVSTPPTPWENIAKKFIPSYFGARNAVCIQLFCVDEKYEMRAGDFLHKVFEVFPDYEYCVITVPHLVPEFPLLQHFVRVTPRVPSTLSHELYVFHRAGLLKNLVVREARDEDYAGVENLVTSLDRSDSLLADLRQFNKAKRDDDGTEIQAWIAECGKQLVGVSIVRREEDIEYVRSHYNVEDFIYYNHHRREEHGHLHHYALNPIFKHLSKYFLKEMLRLGHKTCLYYPLYPPYASDETLSRHTLVGALADMVPVRARRQISYPLDQLGINAPSNRVLKTKPTFALNHINRKLTLEPKVTINARIVVVGASDVGLAFLEALSFCPHLRFNNLTLISPHGLPGELPPDQLRDQTLASTYSYSHEQLAQVSLRTWVNVVYGKMTAIDRKKKQVIVNDRSVVPYDHLVITTGMQYQLPMPTEADLVRPNTNSALPNSPDRRFVGTEPSNLFLINDQYDAAVMIYWMNNNLLNSTGKVIVYGRELDAYCCVQSLLTLGFPGERIVLVEPYLNHRTTCFNNEEVEVAIAEALGEQGIEVYSGYLLAEFNDGNNNTNEISSAAFTSNHQPVRIECAAMISSYKKMVDYAAFKAMNDACLVFDGKLVIDANFHTNDVSIRAAGPVTKYQRSYHSDEWTHANFNSKEIGIQLASNMMTLFDPTLEPEKEPPQDLLKIIPMYRSPKIQGGFLPGGYHYLHVGKPSLNMPLELLQEEVDYGIEIITGTPGNIPDFFKVHLNQYDTVETITCLSKQEFSASNILCLYGLHERYLNNLLSRFEEGLIPDLYAFFQETWTLAIYHDRFPDFRDEIRELLINQPSEDVEALETNVRRMVEEDLLLTAAQRKMLASDYKDHGFKRAVETRVLSFLSYNYYHLPMYAKPGMV